MKTAQETIGEYGVDAIKRIFEDLNEWDKKKVVEYLQSKIGEEDDLATILAYHSDFEILDCIPEQSLIDYVSNNNIEDFLDSLPCDEIIDYLERAWPGEIERYVDELE